MKTRGNAKNFGLIKYHTGQTLTETAILLMVITFALLAMQTYLKRGVQGRLKGDIEAIGPQYDFTASTSDYMTNHVSNVTTTSTTSVGSVEVPGGGGGTIEKTVATSLSTTNYDNTSRTGTETVANP